MTKLIYTLFLYLIIIKVFAQRDSISPEKRVRSSVESFKRNAPQSAVQVADYARIMEDIISVAVIRTPHVTMAELRRGKADTASAVYINEAGRSGLFRYDKQNNTSSDDSAMVIVSGKRRYVRDFDGYVNVKWFGAKGDGVTDDSKSIQKAIDFLNPSYVPVYKWENSPKSGGTVYFPGGRYRITETIWLSNSITILGNSGQSFYSNRFTSTSASHIIADFSEAKFAIQTQSLKTADVNLKATKLTRVAYNELTHWRQSDGKKLGITSGCHVKNIVITKVGKGLLYGGIRFCSTTFSSIDNVGIYDCAVGILIDCGLHVKVSNSHISASTMGIIASQSNNSLSFDHIYINGTGSSFGKIRIPTPRYAAIDFDEPMLTTLNYKDDSYTAAIFINGALNISLNSLTIEGWDIGLVVKNSSVSSNSLYFEHIKDTAFALARCELFNSSFFTTAVENVYGISHSVNLTDFSVKNRYGSYKNLFKNYDRKKDREPSNSKILLREDLITNNK